MRKQNVRSDRRRRRSGRPITYQGRVVASSKEYSDRMLELLLKAHRPSKYKDRVANEHSVGARPIDLMPDFTDDELIALLQAKRGQQRPAEDERHGKSR